MRARRPGWPLHAPDLWAGLALAALTVGAWRLTADMPAQVARYPRTILVALAVLTGLLLVGACRAGARAPGDEPAASGGEPGRVGAMIGAIVAYAGALDLLGFLAATTLAVPIMMWIAGERRWLRLVTVPLVSAVVLHEVFAGLLNVALPRGRLIP